MPESISAEAILAFVKGTGDWRLEAEEQKNNSLPNSVLKRGTQNFSSLNRTALRQRLQTDEVFCRFQ